QAYAGSRTFTVTDTTITWDEWTLTYAGLGSVQIDGGTGGNTFNVFATSPTAAVTLVGGTDDTLVGSDAGNVFVLVGSDTGTLSGAGGNTLNGGVRRRNNLVAGTSASTLNSGDGEDLLIGGSTFYDTEAGLSAWQRIAAFWADGDDYATRVANLLNGHGMPLL